MQRPSRQVPEAPQLLPQLPQWALSVRVSTQCPSHIAVHEMQAPRAQVPPPEHGLPQRPQLDMSV